MALEELEDVAVKMTQENKQVFSVLEIQNLSQQKYVLRDSLTDSLQTNCVTQAWSLQLQVCRAFNAKRHPPCDWWWVSRFYRDSLWAFLFFSFLLKKLEADWRLERGALPVWPGMSQTKVLRVQSNEKPLDEELWVWNDLASVLHNIYWPHFSLHVIYDIYNIFDIYLIYYSHLSAWYFQRWSRASGPTAPRTSWGGQPA